MPSKKTRSTTKEALKPQLSEKPQEEPPIVPELATEDSGVQVQEQVQDQSDTGLDPRDKLVTLPVRELIQMSPDSPYVFHPRFANREKTRIKAILRLPDGRFTEMEVDRSDVRSPLLRDVFAQYTEEEIEMFTVRQLKVSEVRRQLDMRIAEDKALAEQRDATYHAKTEAFQIPAVNEEQNKDLKRRIRQARNVLEVTALTALALMNSKELPDNGEQTDD